MQVLDTSPYNINILNFSAFWHQTLGDVGHLVMEYVTKFSKLK
jgi:hypothetical protein